jgi:hypothetical protein
MYTRCSYDDLEIPALALLLAPVGELLATKRNIRPDDLEAWHEVGEPAEEFAGADRVMDIGGGDVAGDGQPQGVD